jgi:hypothetical protein
MYLFPAYRKYPNNKSYFKVLSADSFEEIQIIGGYYRIDRFTAKILPDRYFISDMLELANGHWVETDGTSFDNFRETCEREFKKALGSL